MISYSIYKTDSNSLIMKSVYIETYGCSANQAHSEIMESSLVTNGFRITKEIGRADIVIVNSCIVKSPTENKIRERIKSFVGRHPDKRLVIAGCAADTGIFRDIAPDAIFLSSHKSKDIAGLFLDSIRESEKRIRKNPLVGITEIASGCLGNCSYCMVKLARGDLVSRPLKEIKKEVKNFLKGGCREIWITSQDCGCYGLDIGTNLAELLKDLVRIKGYFRIRVGMMNPTHVKPILNKLIDVYKNPKIYKFVHIPVQSGSDKILKKMNRGYRTKDFEKMVRKFRSEFPSITLSTDVIVGFPGETEKDFERTVGLIKKVKPDIVNLSKFGPRPKTLASEMKQLDGKTIKKRSIIMADVIREIVFERNKRLVKRKFSVLVNKKGKKNGQFIGRNEYYKPVVLVSKKNIMGKFLRVGITSAGNTYLNGRILKRQKAHH